MPIRRLMLLIGDRGSRVRVADDKDSVSASRPEHALHAVPKAFRHAFLLVEDKQHVGAVPPLCAVDVSRREALGIVVKARSHVRGKPRRPIQSLAELLLAIFSLTGLLG